jgi:hypothetical protein
MSDLELTHTYPTYAYLGLDELGASAHLMVDGARRTHTSRVLSHWPGSATPDHLARDLSAEIALAYLLDEREWDPNTEFVTNDHLDIDGLISLFFLTNPIFALEHAKLLIEIARIGDFGVVRSDAAAAVAWAIDVFMADPQLALVELVDAEMTREGETTRTYRALLQVLPRMITYPDLYAVFIREQRSRYERSRDALAKGLVIQTEHPELDLCIVTVPTGSVEITGASIGDEIPLDVDPLAIQSTTDASRILVCQQNRFVYYDRYETWVRYVSTQHPLRRNLERLASELSSLDVVHWVAGAPSSLVPVLHHGSEPSSLDTQVVVERVTNFLKTAPPAWDPFREEGPLLTDF